MRWEIRLFFQDRDGNRRSCSTWVETASDIAGLVAFANQFGDAVSGVSNAQLVAATLTSRRQVSVSTVAAPTSNTGRKMLLLCTDSATYGSLLIPSPADLPFDLADPESGYRIRKGFYPPGHPIATGIDALAATVTPTNEPFPVDDWFLALITD